MPTVYGAIDQETRCHHYQQYYDRIAIKFYCCGQYYSCIYCHQERGCNKPAVWPKSLFHKSAVLCGACGTQHTINTYLDHHSNCPTCGATYNDNCTNHHHLYFDV